MKKIIVDGPTVKGIDVSHYQQPSIWGGPSLTKRADLGFAFIKATEGLFVTDLLFKTHWKKSKEVQALRGAYHFFHCDKDPVKQADHFASIVPNDFDLPPVMDWETTPDTPSEMDLEYALIFLCEIEKHFGVTPIVYSGPYFLNSFAHFPQFTNLAKYHLWIAHYGVNQPLIPDIWDKWTFWQYSDHFGFGCDADLFNGSTDDLKDLK